MLSPAGCTDGKRPQQKWTEARHSSDNTTFLQDTAATEAALGLQTKTMEQKSSKCTPSLSLYKYANQQELFT